MANLKELFEHYKSRDKSIIVDSIALGASFVDEMSIGLGLIENTDVLMDTVSPISTALPFATVVLHEGSNVLFKHKSLKAGNQDTRYRLVRNGASLVLGTMLNCIGAGIIALPCAIGLRLTLNRFRSKILTSYRVEKRIERIKALQQKELLPSAEYENNLLTESA
ncbi:MAG: hypothetical protein ACOX54_08505 [Christensenellales bacterium]|jgi:hypothetical protein